MNTTYYTVTFVVNGKAETLMTSAGTEWRTGCPLNAETMADHRMWRLRETGHPDATVTVVPHVS